MLARNARSCSSRPRSLRHVHDDERVDREEEDDRHRGEPLDQVEVAAGLQDQRPGDEQGADHEAAEEQADPRAAPGRVDRGEDRRDDVLVGHAVEDARLGDQRDQRRVGDRDQRDDA